MSVNLHKGPMWASARNMAHACARHVAAVDTKWMLNKNAKYRGTATSISVVPGKVICAKCSDVMCAALRRFCGCISKRQAHPTSNC